MLPPRFVEAALLCEGLHESWLLKPVQQQQGNPQKEAYATGTFS
jgi:hypothetical protein